MTHAEGPYGTIDYTYDGVGNRQAKSEGGIATAYTYYPATNRMHQAVTGVETVNHVFDLNGNITGIGNKVLTYNHDNRLVRVEEGGAVLGEYTYNGLGQRVIKTAGGVTTVFLYDFDGNIIGESDQTGSISKEYLYKGSSRLAMVDVLNGKRYYYGNDQLGTPQIMTDSTNTVVWEADYKPFGEADVNPNSSVVNNFMFPGQSYDAETRLHYNYHRYYDPKTGLCLAWQMTFYIISHYRMEQPELFKINALYDNGNLCNAAIWRDWQGVKMPAATTFKIHPVIFLLRG